MANENEEQKSANADQSNSSVRNAEYDKIVDSVTGKIHDESPQQSEPEKLPQEKGGAGSPNKKSEETKASLEEKPTEKDTKISVDKEKAAPEEKEAAPEAEEAENWHAVAANLSRLFSYFYAIGLLVILFMLYFNLR